MDGKLRLGLMIRGTAQPQWVRSMLERAITDSCAEIVLVIDDAREESGESFLGKLLRSWHKILFLLYTAIDERVFRAAHNAFASATIDDLIRNADRMRVVPISTKLSDRFNDEDITAIQSYNLDVILRLDFRILRGAILDCARCGVWSFHHGDNRVNRGGPPGYWEVMERDGATGVTLQILTEDLDGGIVLDRSSACTHPYSVNRNLNSFYWNSVPMLQRSLRRLQTLGREQFLSEAAVRFPSQPFYTQRLYKTPTNRVVLKHYFALAGRLLGIMLQGLITKDQWSLFVASEKQSGLMSRSFFRFKRIQPPSDRFWADPFVIERDGKRFIAIEELPYATGKGHISMIELRSDGSIGKPQIIINEAHHLSYPFMIEDCGNLYMIPESQQNKTIDLYICDEFPNRWRKVMTLMSSVEAVDATVFKHDGRYWMFTNIRSTKGGSTWNELSLFSAAELCTTEWTPHPMNPIVRDVTCARPAGAVYQQNGQLFRPSQNCSGHYGRAIVIARIDVLTATEYKESFIQQIEPDWAEGMISTHTLNHHGSTTVTDGLFRIRR
ncbi:MAG: hypothetical protein JNL32_09385 [Candidatus Kapabacteria bacterium]|nr:hypothetical protein [Candidatus Kapabacteria bacterium]